MTLLQPTLIDFLNFAPQKRTLALLGIAQNTPNHPHPPYTSFGQLFHYFAKCLTLLKKMGEMIILESKINYEDVSGGDTGLPELMVKLSYIDFRCS